MQILCTYDHARISLYMCVYAMYWHKANTYIQPSTDYTDIRTCVYVYIIICIYIYIQIHANAYKQKTTYIYIYTHIHTYAHNITAADDCIQWYDLTLRPNLQAIAYSIYRDTKVQPNAWLVGLKKKRCPIQKEMLQQPTPAPYLGDATWRHAMVKMYRYYYLLSPLDIIEKPMNLSILSLINP